MCIRDRRLDPGRDRTEAAMSLKDPATGAPGIVLGMHISVFNERRADGTYGFQAGDTNYWMPGKQVELTLVPIKGGRLSIEPESRAFSIVNEFQSGVFEIDKNRVLISLQDAQEMLRLGSGTLYDQTGKLDPETGMPLVLGESCLLYTSPSPRDS